MKRHLCAAFATLTVVLMACRESAPLDPSRGLEQQVTADSVVVGYRLVPGWPDLPAGLRLGEVAGVDIDSRGDVLVFHRADRGWDTETLAPIPEPTVLRLDHSSGKLLAAWGEHHFRLPHGLTVDRSDQIWLTDAASHQVFHFRHDGQLLKNVGEANVGRWDASHFNRPTDVAARADGGFYVSDGYENHRVVELDARGRYIREWGRLGRADGELALPHGITSHAGLLYVADRENGRVVVFDSNGVFRHAWSPWPGARVYAVAIDAAGGVYAALRDDATGLGGVVRLDDNGTITHRLGAVPSGSGEFLAVHDLAVGADGAVYVAENRAGGLRKFVPVKAASPH